LKKRSAVPEMSYKIEKMENNSIHSMVMIMKSVKKRWSYCYWKKRIAAPEMN
jgi:hypothetical protein